MLPRGIVAALFGGLFSLQLALSGATAACPMTDAETRTEIPIGGMAGMVMSGHVVSEEPSATADGTSAPDAPCEHPASPKPCRLMAACATGVLAPIVSLATAAHPASTSAVASIVWMPLSVTSPPEPPPPRA